MEKRILGKTGIEVSVFGFGSPTVPIRLAAQGAPPWGHVRQFRTGAVLAAACAATPVDRLRLSGTQNALLPARSLNRSRLGYSEASKRHTSQNAGAHEFCLSYQVCPKLVI